MFPRFRKGVPHMVKIASRFGGPGRESIINSGKEQTKAIIPASQHTGIPAPRHIIKKPTVTSIPVSQHAGKPVIKQKNKKTITSTPARQHASKPVSQQRSKPKPKGNTSIPVSQHAGILTKATFYIYPEQIIDLEKLRLNHLTTKKEKIDKSELVRQAINILVAQQAGK